MHGEGSLTHGVVSFGPFRLFAAERQLRKGDEPLQLGGRALDTLIALVERAGEVVTQRELISRVWPEVTVEEANLRYHIANLALAEVLEDRRGRKSLRLDFQPGGGFLTGDLTPEMAAEAEKLVEELRAVKAARY